MAKVARYVLLAGGLFGGIFYGRMYVDVLMAESTVRSIEREVKTTMTERENLKHEITSNKKALDELEVKGTAKLKEQASIRERVDETTGLLTKLKNELLQSTNEFDRLQLKTKETQQRVERLQLTDAQKQESIELAKGRREHAQLDVVAARKAMQVENLPLFGSLLSKPSAK